MDKVKNNQFTRPLIKVPAEELIDELHHRQLIESTINECLECGHPIKGFPIPPLEESYPMAKYKCPKCGHIHNITLTWTLESVYNKCKVCGNSYIGDKYDDYCSLKCKNTKFCVLCSNKIKNSKHGNFCSSKCKKEYDRKVNVLQDKGYI